MPLQGSRASGEPASSGQEPPASLPGCGRSGGAPAGAGAIPGAAAGWLACPSANWIAAELVRHSRSRRGRFLPVAAAHAAPRVPLGLARQSPPSLL